MNWLHILFPPRAVSIVEGTALVAAGPAINYLIAQVSSANLGPWVVLAPIVVAGLNALRHYLGIDSGPPAVPPMMTEDPRSVA